MKPYAVVVALAVALSGCVSNPPKTWYKEGGTKDQFAHDKLSCMQYGQQSAMANGLAGNMFVGSWVTREAESCMVSLGYHQ